MQHKKIRPTEKEQLISDYNRDLEFIRRQKRKWLTPKERPNASTKSKPSK